MKKVWFIIVIVVVTIGGIALLKYPPPLTKFNKTPVHLSIDDVEMCLKELSCDSAKYTSVYDQPFFAYLKQMHDSYGAKFTLYVYLESGDWKIDDMPVRYRQELITNSNWLKFGFHSIRPVFSQHEIANIDSFSQAYRRVCDGIERFAGSESLTKILRLHYFFATRAECDYLKNKGVNTLLTADDPNRESYSIVPNHRRSYGFKGINYLATDYRIENGSLSPWYDLYEHAENDTLAIFTHEWALLNRVNRYKLNSAIRILSNSGAQFVN